MILHTARLIRDRVNESWVFYKIEGQGHGFMYPRHWFPMLEEPPKVIEIELRTTQLDLFKGE